MTNYCTDCTCAPHSDPKSLSPHKSIPDSTQTIRTQRFFTNPQEKRGKNTKAKRLKITTRMKLRLRFNQNHGRYQPPFLGLINGDYKTQTRWFKTYVDLGLNKGTKARVF
jgi:hypothetical protein